MQFKTTLVLASVALFATVGTAACSSTPATPIATAIPIAATLTVEVPVLDGPDGPLAPDFTLTSATGEAVSLTDLLEGRDATVIVFYRGFF